jgi:hypothetical protein
MEKRAFQTLTIISLALNMILSTLSVREALAVESTLKLNQKWTGDFDSMVERYLIRALVP